MTLPVTLRAFTLKGHHKKSIRVRQDHYEKRHLPQHPRHLGQHVTKIYLRFSRAVIQRHMHLLGQPLYLPNRFLDLGILALVAHLLDALVYTLGSMTLLLWKCFILFYDPSNLLKVGANLRLGAGVVHPITGRLGMLDYLLQRLPGNSFTSENLPLTPLSS